MADCGGSLTPDVKIIHAGPVISIPTYQESQMRLGQADSVQTALVPATLLGGSVTDLPFGCTDISP
jgi:hypothetical protein